MNRKLYVKIEFKNRTIEKIVKLNLLTSTQDNKRHTSIRPY